MKAASKPILIAGYSVQFVRRHYGGGHFYCWVQIMADGQWLTLPGDPWPCHTPKHAEVEREIIRFRAQPAVANAPVSTKQ